jgi:hypothetical protein
MTIKRTRNMGWWKRGLYDGNYKKLLMVVVKRRSTDQERMKGLTEVN